jgi:hypothetical protein
VGLMLALLVLAQDATCDPEAEADRAVVRAAALLRSKEPDSDASGEWIAWALLGAGDDRTGPFLRERINRLLQQAPATTRSAALQACILQMMGDAKYRGRLIHCAQFLIDNQCEDGLWDEGRPIEAPPLPAVTPPNPRAELREFGGPPIYREKLKIERRGQGAAKGNVVDAYWAMRGLKALDYVGYQLPADVYERAERAWRKESGDAARQLSCLSFHLYKQKKEWKTDPDILKDLERLIAAELPKDPNALSLLKAAMMHFGSETFDGRRLWWQEGARLLIASQAPDGGWGGVEETCAAVDFLYRYRGNSSPLRYERRGAK